MDKTIYTPAYRRLIDELKEVRRKQGMRQKDVALRIGVSRNWVSKIERFELRLDVLFFVRVCLALEVDPVKILKPLIDEVVS